MTEARARALLTRLGTFLDQFTTCFSRRAHRTYASRYLQGLLNDSPRKSMQPMNGPGFYQSLQPSRLEDAEPVALASPTRERKGSSVAIRGADDAAQS